MHETPIGLTPGFLVHANYFESLYDSRIYRPWRGWFLKVLEVIVSLAIAIPFALDTRFLFKFAAVALISLLLVAFSFLSLMVLGCSLTSSYPSFLFSFTGWPNKFASGKREQP